MIIFTKTGPESIFIFTKQLGLEMFRKKCIQNFISDLKEIPALIKRKIEAGRELFLSLNKFLQ